MFAVMKHWDIMIGLDAHTCWPPGSPYPIGPKPYIVCMLMTGTMLTAQMAFTAVTFNGWTMKRGTDIGPLIPHIGQPSLLTPLDMLFSSSASYFGPSSHTVEGAPVAAALFMFANPNLNCHFFGPAPTGIVLCFTTHYVGMSIFDILFGVISMAVAIVIDVATGAVAGAASKAAQKTIIKPITRRVSAKLASRKAAKAATPSTGALTPGASTTPSTGALTPGTSAPAKAPPGTWQSAKPSQPAGSQGPSAPAKAPPGTWQPAKPSQPAGSQGTGNPPGPQFGGHRPPVKPPKKRKTRKQFALDLGLEAFGELALGLPFSVVNELTFELLSRTGVEEFGKREDEKSSEET
ncbi:MAG TPA: hypothetical protein VGB85_04400 [Nannocystis sp.]|jgi:hypothetical protein